MLKCLPLSCPQVCNKIIFLMSFVGNCGTFTRGYRAMVLDVEFLYHLLYLLICALGLFVHEFFYSLLVSPRAPRANRREGLGPSPLAPPVGFSPHPRVFFPWFLKEEREGQKLTRERCINRLPPAHALTGARD